MWFKEQCFELVQQEKALFRIPVGEKFSSTERPFVNYLSSSAELVCLYIFIIHTIIRELKSSVLYIEAWTQLTGHFEHTDL